MSRPDTWPNTCSFRVHGFQNDGGRRQAPESFRAREQCRATLPQSHSVRGVCFLSRDRRPKPRQVSHARGFMSYPALFVVPGSLDAWDKAHDTARHVRSQAPRPWQRTSPSSAVSHEACGLAITTPSTDLSSQATDWAGETSHLSSALRAASLPRGRGLRGCARDLTAPCNLEVWGTKS